MRKTKLEHLLLLNSHYLLYFFLVICFGSILWMTVTDQLVLHSGSFTDKHRTVFHAKTIQDNGPIVHVWNGLCLKDLEVLCNYPLFPNGPDNEFSLSSSSMIYKGDDTAIRMFGFLTPPETGSYKFALVSNGFTELWISTEEHWSNSKLVGRVLAFETGGSASRSFEEMRLVKNKNYFFDLLHLSKDKKSKLDLFWQLPGRNELFEIISDRHILPFRHNVSEQRPRSKIFPENIPRSAACLMHQYNKGHNHFLSQRDTVYLNPSEAGLALPVCTYTAGLQVRGKLTGWAAVHKYFRPTHVFPWPEHKDIDEKKYWFPMNKTHADIFVGLFMSQLEKNYPRKFSLHSVVRVEAKGEKIVIGLDEDKERRYFVELELDILPGKQRVTFAEYIFRLNRTSLCYPQELKWNKTAKIYFVVTAKDQAKWLRHFISNIETIYRQTEDSNLGVVVLNYESAAFDLENVLKRSGLPDYRFATRAGNYSRTESLNAAIKLITDPDSIVAIMDLHLDITREIIDEIRKRTIKGQLMYTPTIVRLECGSSSLRPKGFWDGYGYGLLSMYKSDFDRTGGLGKNGDKYRWGGEDWDFMDRVVGVGLEYERVRCPYIYHYEHPQKMKLWSAV